MDRPPISFFFVRAVLRERAIEALARALPRWVGQVLTKTSCRGHLHCAEWLCIVLSDSLRRRNGSGRNWPYKSATRTEVWHRLFVGDHSPSSALSARSQRPYLK